MKDYTDNPFPAKSVTVNDPFWTPRLDQNRIVTIPTVFQKCQQTGLIDNFRKAAGTLPGSYQGHRTFDDTDVYKALEGASLVLAHYHDPELDAFVDQLITIIASAQEEDGYLYTNRTINPQQVHEDAGPHRWSNLSMSHELYNCGHLCEAACAHYLSTGKSGLLNIACRFADLVCKTFGPHGLDAVPGHQIIETGLSRLYRITKQQRYLTTALFFLDRRGYHQQRPQYHYDDNLAYSQDHLPVLKQTVAAGHAVRSLYMYNGMVEIAALLDRSDYAAGALRLWNDIYSCKVAISGGVGARHQAEAFGEAWELPNLTAYNETCAAIAAVQWNHRLWRLTGQAVYLDVVEHSLYNAILAGISLSGDRYFYVNPLASDGQFAFNHGSVSRQAWFDVSCCPTNLSRFFPALPQYIWGRRGRQVSVNLYIAGSVEFLVDGQTCRICQSGNYPWDGRINFEVDCESALDMTLSLRIPGWSQQTVLGSGLYHFCDLIATEPKLTINEQEQPVLIEQGWLNICRRWQPKDRLVLELPMPIRFVGCDQRVIENRAKRAIMRGPLLYCVEQKDSVIDISDISMGEQFFQHAEYIPDLLGGLTVIKGRDCQAIPYYAWANRGPDQMAVWLPE